MRMFDIARRAARSLRTAKARTALTSLAIAVGAFTLTLTLAAGNGIREYTDRLVASNFDPAELIVGRDEEVENSGAPNAAPREYDESITSVSVGPGEGGGLQLKQLNDEDIAELESLPYVESARPLFTIPARYVSSGDSKRYTLDLMTYSAGQKPETVAGDLSDVVTLNSGEAILPLPYIELLGFSSPEDAIGKTITVNVSESISPDAFAQAVIQSQMTGQPINTDALRPGVKDFTFTVKAVSKRSATSIAIAGLPILVGSKDARTMYDYAAKGTSTYGKYIYAYVRVIDGEKEGVAQESKVKLKDMGYFVQTSEDIQATITQFVDILQILVGVFGVITVIASIFGIVNTMYISVLERTRQIGLMKALGMRGGHVSWLFRLEAAWIGFLGGALGALVAFLLGIAINPWLTETLGLGEGNSILVFNFVQILVLIVILVLVAIIAGWFPARKAARLDPIEALRTE
jgi:putative ABC transport system permease protein